MPNRIWIVIGCLCAAIGVAMGAYQAHGLEKMLAGKELAADEIAKQLQNCAIGARYQLAHGIGLALLGVIALRRKHLLMHIAGGLMLFGVCGFSGGLYLQVFGVQALHWIIPIGGLSLIISWVLTAFGAFGLTEDEDSITNSKKR